MPNGKEINDRLEFQERIKSLAIEERTTETALMIYDLNHKFDEYLDPLKGKRDGAITGGISGAIIGIVIGVINYFTNRN